MLLNITLTFPDAMRQLITYYIPTLISIDDNKQLIHCPSSEEIWKVIFYFNGSNVDSFYGWFYHTF